MSEKALYYFKTSSLEIVLYIHAIKFRFRKITDPNVSSVISKFITSKSFIIVINGVTIILNTKLVRVNVLVDETALRPSRTVAFPFGNYQTEVGAVSFLGRYIRP